MLKRFDKMSIGDMFYGQVAGKLPRSLFVKISDTQCVHSLDKSKIYNIDSFMEFEIYKSKNFNRYKYKEDQEEEQRVGIQEKTGSDCKSDG